MENTCSTCWSLKPESPPSSRRAMSAWQGYHDMTQASRSISRKHKPGRTHKSRYSSVLSLTCPASQAFAIRCLRPIIGVLSSGPRDRVSRRMFATKRVKMLPPLTP
jgi:hypothetical protein